jgi:hypothetical protein
MSGHLVKSRWRRLRRRRRHYGCCRTCGPIERRRTGSKVGTRRVGRQRLTRAGGRDRRSGGIDSRRGRGRTGRDGNPAIYGVTWRRQRRMNGVTAADGGAQRPECWNGLVNFAGFRGGRLLAGRTLDRLFFLDGQCRLVENRRGARGLKIAWRAKGQCGRAQR